MNKKEIEQNGLKMLLEQHRLTATSLKSLKEVEAKLRIKIADIYKDKGFNTIGTHCMQMDGMDIKMVLKINTKLDAEILEGIIEDLTDEELACIRYKPELKMKEYNTLTVEQNEDDIYLDDAVTTSDAMPSLEITLSETQ